MNAWFGTDWGAPYCHSTPRVAVPVGESCLHCEEAIDAADSGVVTPLMDGEGVRAAYYHVECWGRVLLGSTGHQLRLCPCFGGTYEGEPPEMSKRDAARAAWDLSRRIGQRGDN
jgi:hypothetical protein